MTPENSYSFQVQEFKRGSWKTVVTSEILEYAIEVAQQRAVRTLEPTRVVRVDVSQIDFFLYAR